MSSLYISISSFLFEGKCIVNVSQSHNNNKRVKSYSLICH